MTTPPTFDLAVDAVLRMAGASDIEVDQVIRETLASLSSACRCERAYVTQFHADGTFTNSHEWTSSHVVPHQPVIQALPVDRFPYSSQLAADGQVLNIGSLDELPPEGTQERESFGSFGVLAVLQVPIIVDGELVGLVGLNRLTVEGDWDAESVERVHLVGRAIGVALSRRNAGERLKRALVTAERAGRAKDDLIARASHELRTPLHAILGFAELLQLDVDSEALRQIRGNGQLLLSMIDDLLALGQSFDASGESALVGDLLTEIFASLATVAHQRDVSLATEEAAGPLVTDDALIVRQVLHCVASTALTVAGRGGKVVAALTSGDPPVVTFLCRGPALQKPGVLALALARSFADQCGGSVTVSAEANAVLIDVTLDQTPRP